MELIIDLPDDIYNRIFEEDWGGITTNVIKNGIPLPKEHGRLSDKDELTKNIVKEYGVNSIHELPQDIKMFYNKFINSASTILDATFDYRLKNYAFFIKENEK